MKGKKNIKYHGIPQVSGFLLILSLTFSIFFSISVQGASSASIDDVSYSWPMFHYDLGRTGFTESPAPTTNNLLWRFRTQDVIDSSPAVVDDIVYIGSRDGKIYALNATTGDEIWSYKTGNWFFFDSPAVADGKVFIGSGDQRVYSFDAKNGTVLWKFKMGWENASSPAVVDGIVFIGGPDKYIYALNETTGELVRKYGTDSFVTSPPAVVHGKVFIGGWDPTYKFYCLDGRTGELIWSYKTRGVLGGSPA